MQSGMQNETSTDRWRQLTSSSPSFTYSSLDCCENIPGMSILGKGLPVIVESAWQQREMDAGIACFPSLIQPVA